MRGSFSIEASLIVPLVLAVMVLALRTGIDCYEETKAQVAKLGTQTLRTGTVNPVPVQYCKTAYCSTSL